MFIQKITPTSLAIILVCTFSPLTLTAAELGGYAVASNQPSASTPVEELLSQACRILKLCSSSVIQKKDIDNEYSKIY